MTKPVQLQVYRSDVTRMLLWTPVFACGIWLAQAFVSQATSFQHFWAPARTPVGPRNPAIREASRQRALGALCQAVLGNSKQNVTRILGKPRVAGPAPAGETPLARAFWDADTWYYLLDAGERCGLAIEFAQGRAAKVDCLRPVGANLRAAKPISRSPRPA